LQGRARHFPGWFQGGLYPTDFNMFLANFALRGKIALNAKGWGQEVVSG
jgi:hypothetical protein